MSDYLARGASPLNSEQWETIDKAVIETARELLIGRRFIPILGPLGAGVEVVPLDSLGGATIASLGASMCGNAEVVQAVGRRFLALPTIHKDFEIGWRELESQEKLGIPFEVSRAVAAARACAKREDDLIFNGSKELGIDGILTVSGRKTMALGDWGAADEGYANVVAAIEKLVGADQTGPYAVIMSPRLYSLANQVHKGTHMLEIDRIKRLAEAGVFQSPVVPVDACAVISLGSENMDLAIAQDMTVAFLESSNMVHKFRVFEILAPRIKNPEAICVIERS